MKVEMRKKMANFDAVYHNFNILVMDIVKAVKSQINKVAPENEVILFGSRARGDHRKDSDWDFLILINAEQVSRQLKSNIQNQLYNLELETDEVISSIIYTKHEWEKMAVSTIYKIIKKEGIRS